MKFFGWMQNKLSGKQGNHNNNNNNVITKKPNTSLVGSFTRFKTEEFREEFSDRPHRLLAIGTFGSNNDNNANEEIQRVVEREEEDQQADKHPSDQEDPVSYLDDFQDFTHEEIGKLHKELTKKANSDKENELIVNLPRFLNCSSSLEVDRSLSTGVASSLSESFEEHDNKEECDIERTLSVILDRCKDIRSKKKDETIGKKPISFLLKKMFVCSSGFPPLPSLSDSPAKSRTEKLLTTLLRKKLSSQNCASKASPMKRYIGDKLQQCKGDQQQEDEERR